MTYSEIVSAVDEATKDPRVRRIHLEIDSPGGIVAGVDRAVAALQRARQAKLLTAHIQDVGTSAAYWLAAQAEIVSAGTTAEVGSIGVYTSYVDSSARARNTGIEVIVIRSGIHEAMGFEGVPIMSEQIAAVQENVDTLGDLFIRDVARGRGKSEFEIHRLSTGRTWTAGTAMELGLIDELQ